MNEGDYIYYYRKGINFSDCIPAIVMKVGRKKIKIAYSFEKDECKWVNKSNCELQ